MRIRAAIVGAGVVVLIVGAVVLLTSTQSRDMPTVADLRMPVPRAPLDRTLTIGLQRGVTVGDGTRLAVESRYGQFRGHWWWNRGWIYVSGQVLPGSRIHVHINAESLTITETPDVRAVAQVRRLYGTKAMIGDDIEVDVVRFGIGAMLFATRTDGGPFLGQHVVDQLDGRAWSSRGLTITRDQVTSTPADHVPCTLVQPARGWNLGCRLLGQPPLESDRRGRFPSSPNSIVEANAISLTVTPNRRTQLPADSLRVEW